MPRRREQEPEGQDGQVAHEQEQEQEQEPYVPILTEEVRELARQEEDAARQLADITERRRQKEREARERIAENAERSAKLSELRAEVTSELDAILAEILGVRILGDLRGLGPRLDRVRLRYEESAIDLGDPIPDGFLNRHPVIRLMPLLVMFPETVGQ